MQMPLLTLSLFFVFCSSLSPPSRVPHAQQIIHPNIYKDGKVCITSLQTAVPDNLRTKDSCPKNLNWNPSIGVAGALLGVISLLSEPNFDDPGREGGAWRCCVLLWLLTFVLLCGWVFCSSVVADVVLFVLLSVLLFSQQ